MPATSLVHSIKLTRDVGSKLSIASLNVQYLPTTLPAVLELLGDAKCDIVGLQEVNMHVGSKATVRALCWNAGYHTYFGDSADGFILTLTLSRVKLSPLAMSNPPLEAPTRAQLFAVPITGGHKIPRCKPVYVIHKLLHKPGSCNGVALMGVYVRPN